MNPGTEMNHSNWEDIYSQKKAGNFLLYPSEHLVSLFYQNRSTIRCAGNCLDYGFGSGNNSEFLIQQMGQLYGVEIAPSSVQIAQQRLEKYTNYHQDNFKISTVQDQFSPAFFDLIVAWQMLYYNDRDSLITAIEKMHRYLKHDGKLICTLITTNDIKVRYADRIAKDTYRIDQRIPHQVGCEVYSPASKDDFLALFGSFRVIDFGYYERSSLITGSTTSEYYLVGAKQ